MTVIPHNYNHLAGKVVYWDTSDSQENYQKNLQDPQTRQCLESLGYVDYTIEYRFNSHGFRTAEFDCQPHMVCFGCSFTMGTGVRIEHTWPSQLSQLTGHSILNLAHAGASNDTVYRMASHYLPALKPKAALWLQTDAHRLEIVDQTHNVAVNIMAADDQNVFANNLFVKTWLSSEINQDLLLDKNTRAFKHLCAELDIKPVILPRNQAMPVDLARDLAHPGPQTYQQLASLFESLL